MHTSQKKSFTLVELIVVIAIIAVVGSGVAVSYIGLEQEKKDEMTLYEMNEIKKAFTRFYDDNYLKLNKPLEKHNGTTETDKMVYFETYGLWALLKKKIEITGSPDMEFPEYDSLKENGWNGPYLENMNLYSGKSITVGGYEFPQINDKYADYYRIVHLNAGGYKKLLLVCIRGVQDVTSANAISRIDVTTEAVKLKDTSNDDLVMELLNEN